MPASPRIPGKETPAGASLGTLTGTVSDDGRCIDGRRIDGRYSCSIFFVNVAGIPYLLESQKPGAHSLLYI